MKITELNPQKRFANRLNMYIDGTFHSGLDVGTAARLGLYKEKEVTTEFLELIDSEEEYQLCMNTALNLASRRLQSEREYWQKLSKKYKKKTIGQVLDRLRTLGYADDQKFAETWVRERSRTRGTILLRQELEAKGIDRNIIEALLTKEAATEHSSDALALAQKKYRPELSSDKNYSRIAGLLTRRGYSYDIIKKVTAEMLDKKTTD